MRFIHTVVVILDANTFLDCLEAAWIEADKDYDYGWLGPPMVPTDTDNVDQNMNHTWQVTFILATI